MAKAKIDTSELLPKKTESDTASFVSGLLASNQKKLGQKNVFVGTNNRVIGMEPYSIALQYLMDLEVFPLQSIISIAGEAKCYKTSGLIEFCSMAMQDIYNGIGIIINTEGKWSDSKVKSMLGDRAEKLTVIHATSVEEWQLAGTNTLNYVKDAVVDYKAKKGPVVPPIVIGVDSLTGSQSLKIKEEVEKEGFGKKTYQDRAQINSMWFRSWGSELVGLPVTVVVSQHLLDKIDGNATGLPIKTTAGGTTTGFMCSMEIRVQNAGDIKKAASEGAYLTWRMHYNSLGRDKRRIKIPYIETYDSNDAQKAYFDWDEALIILLLDLFENNTDLRDRLKAVLGNVVEYPKPGVGKVYTCDKLNITRTTALEDNITASVLGKLIQSNPDLRSDIKKALRIQSGVKWTPDLDM